MDDVRKGEIYERLLGIQIHVDSDPVPKPAYINDKIWECHRYIGEVERFHIQLTQEFSVMQQALNNAEAEYQSKKDKLLIDPDIAALPGAKDREAKANQSLTAELKMVRERKNELADLNNLLRAVDMKLRNLNRTNGDIRLQVRVLEAQVKLNALPKSDPVTAGLLEEMNKGRAGVDVFGDAETNEVSTEVHDPVSPITVDTLLTLSDSTSVTSDATTDTLLTHTEQTEEPEGGVLGSYATGEDWELGASTAEEETATVVVDLDQVLNIEAKGGEQAANPTQDLSAISGSIQKPSGQPQTAPPSIEQPKTSTGIDIDDLLDSINSKA